MVGSRGARLLMVTTTYAALQRRASAFGEVLPESLGCPDVQGSVCSGRLLVVGGYVRCFELRVPTWLFHLINDLRILLRLLNELLIRSFAFGAVRFQEQSRRRRSSFRGPLG